MWPLDVLDVNAFWKRIFKIIVPSKLKLVAELINVLIVKSCVCLDLLIIFCTVKPMLVLNNIVKKNHEK